MTEQISKQLISDLSRGIVAQIAPEELPLFRSQSDAYFKNPELVLNPKIGKDEVLGSGVAVAITFITPFVLEIMKELTPYIFEQVKKAIHSESVELIEETIRKVFAGLGSRQEAKTQQKTEFTLTKDQIAEIRKIIKKKGSILNVPDTKLRALEDMIIAGIVAG